MIRVYYHLEPAGCAYLQKLLEEYNDIAIGMKMIMEATKS